MSLPALKTVASPCSTTTRTASSVAAEFRASAMLLYMAWVMEFFLSTRLSVMVRTPASVCTKMSWWVVSVMCFPAEKGQSPARRACGMHRGPRGVAPYSL